MKVSCRLSIAHLKVALYIFACLAFLGARARILAQGDGELPYRELQSLHFPSVSDIAWRPDGSQLAIVSFPSIYLWDTESEKLTTLISDAQINEVAWSPDGTKIASAHGGKDESLEIWDASTGRLLKHISRPQPYGGYIYRLSWSPDGKRIASDGTDFSVLIWNLFGNEEVDVLGSHQSMRIGETDWSPDSSYLVSSGGDGIFIWDVATGKVAVTLDIGGLSVDWSPIDDRVAGDAERAGQAYVWDAKTGQELKSFDHGASVLSVRWNFDASTIATGGLDGVIKIWNAQSGVLLASMNEHAGLVIALAWHPNQNLLASASYDGSVRLWKFDHH